MQAANPPSSSRIQEQFVAHLPLMWFSLAFLTGIVLGSLVSLPIWAWLVLAGIFLALAFSLRFFSLSSFLPQVSPVVFNPFPFILLFALCLGGARYQLSVPKFDAFHISFYNDRDYDLLITGYLV